MSLTHESENHIDKKYEKSSKDLKQTLGVVADLSVDSLVDSGKGNKGEKNQG